MADRISIEKRQKIMSSIRGKDTKPELTLRGLLWECGKRYRIHDKSVPGKPDISNKSKKIAVFVDGCFWHACELCYKEPQTNTVYWRNKIIRNKARREEVRHMLNDRGWKVVEIWEHEINNDKQAVLLQLLQSF
jgi:DNA mismatch endonuclease (patch repair protein)